MLTDHEPIRAAGVAELAQTLGIEGTALVETIGSYNTAAASNELSARDPFGLDGLATQGLNPPKSNWATPLDATRLVAWPLTTAIVFTFGGIKVDTDTHVLRPDGSSIPGLLAAGECTGIYYHKYPGATSVMRAVTFGRVAGREAANRLTVGSGRSQPS